MNCAIANMGATWRRLYIPQLAEAASASERSSARCVAGVSRSVSREVARGVCRVKLTWLGHGTVRIDTGGVVVMTDPLLVDRLSFIQRVVPPPPTESWH